MAQQYQFGRVPDSAVLSLIKALVANQEDGAWSITTLDSSRIQGKSNEVLSDGWRSVLNSSSYLITRATATVDSASLKLTYYRGHKVSKNPNGGWMWARSDNPFVDGVEIEGPTGNDNQLGVLRALNEFLGMAPPVGYLENSPALDQSAAIINRVSEAIATLVEHTSERQRDLDATRASIEKDSNKLIRDLEKSLKDQYESRVAALGIKEEELDKRSYQLDDRENTHVRRELQKGMANLSDTTLSQNLLSKSSRSFFQVITPTLLIAALLAAGALLQGIELTNNPPKIENAFLFGEIRTIILGVGAGALIWFAVRLAGNRYKQVTKWEQDLHRFRLDTERASFLVEGDLEARKVNELGLPDVLLDRFSRGLFSGTQSSQADDDDVGNTLAQLLSRAASVKIGTDGISVEVDKAGIKKARRAAQAEDE